MTTSTPPRPTARTLLVGAWHFANRYLPDLLGWAATLLLIVGIVIDRADETWFVSTLAVIAATWAVLIGIPAARDAVGEYRYRKTLLDLADMDREQRDPTSGVWVIASPCGYEEWELYAPGQAYPDAPFPLRDVTPTATMPALEPGPAQELPSDHPQSIEQIRGWAIPWVEEVSGGRVVEMLMGWGAPYGTERVMREVAVFARVEQV